MIETNEKLPSAELQYFKDSEMVTVTTEDLFAGKKVVLFAVPGAFTPLCSGQHLPGYIELAEQFYQKSVDSIICLSVNDAFVMDAWGKASGSKDIIMLADGSGEFTQALGLSTETGIFGGLRSCRYAMIVEDGVVTSLQVEAPKEFNVSKAEYMLDLV